MTTQIKLLLGLLAIAVIGLAVVLLMSDPDPVLIPEDPGTKKEQPVDPGKAEDLEAGRTEPRVKEDRRPEPIREKNPGRMTSGATHPQGVTGTVVDEFGSPVAEATVYLMPGLGIESLAMFRQHQQGVRFPAIAETTTAADGVFRVGIETWKEGKQYEVRILHDEYCDAKLPNLIVQPQDWYEAGKIELKKGIDVFGRVTNETGLPVPNAKVSVRDASGMLNITPTPGREEGITAMTDAGGNYEIRNLDPVSMFAMSAVAPNFAKSEKSELHLAVGKRHQVDFQLVQGLDIAGTIVDPHGKPIRRAKVTVAALSQKSQQTETTTTDEDGYFRTPGLRVGVYAVLVEAEGYLNADEKPIAAGKTDLTITLEQQGIVIVTVLDKNGRPLPNYHCNLKAAFEGQDTYGNPLVSKQVKGAAEGTVTITGVNPLTYVAEIHAEGHAKNFSERFTITEGQMEAPRITVQLNEGGVILGFVKDEKGNPIQGVRVATMPNGLVENPFTKMFQVPYTITKMNLVTPQTGAFRFNMLYSGKYQLKFEHPQYCSLFLKDLQVTNGETTTLGDVMMDPGCLVSGLARVNGKVAGQVRVNVSAVQDKENPGLPLSCEAVSDNEGRFLLDKRLPPGSYQVMAAENVQANPLIMMVQFNKSKKNFVINRGQTNHVLQIDLEKLD